MLYLESVDFYEVLCCVPALALLLFATVPWHRKWVRSRLTPRMQAIVRRQLPLVMRVNGQLRSTAMDVLTLATDITVTIYFYITALCVSYMLGFTNEALKLCAGLAFTTYLTSALKDLFCCPRPLHIANKEQRRQLLASSGCREDEDHDTSNEYGAPSLHTSAGLFSALLLVHTLIEHQVLPTSPLSYVPALLWGVWIGLTRVYLGLHTPLDLGLGAVVGAAVFGMWAAVADEHQEWVTSPGDQAVAAARGSEDLPAVAATAGESGSLPAWARGVVGVASHAGALLWYPRPLHRTESFAHATTFLGAWGGFPVVHAILERAMDTARAVTSGLAHVLLGQPHRPPSDASAFGPTGVLPQQLQRQLLEASGEGEGHGGGGGGGAAVAGGRLLPLLRDWGLAGQGGRLLVGVLLVLLTRTVVKALLTPIVKAAMDLLPLRVRLALQPPIAHAPISFQRASSNAAATLAPHKQPSGFDGSEDACADSSQHQAPSSTADQNGHASAVVGTDAASSSTGGGTEGATGGTCTVIVPPQHASSTGDAVQAVHLPGVELRPDGYPWDADAVRRYLCYCAMAVAAILFHHATDYT